MGDSSPGSRADSGPVNRSFSPDVLRFDDAFEALTHRRRRYLCYLLREDGAQSVADLAREVAAWEADVPTDAVPVERCQEAYVALHHAHVPKLVDAGVVDLDVATGVVAPGENADRAFAALDGAGAALAALPGDDGE